METLSLGHSSVTFWFPHFIGQSALCPFFNINGIKILSVENVQWRFIDFKNIIKIKLKVEVFLKVEVVHLMCLPMFSLGKNHLNFPSLPLFYLYSKYWFLDLPCNIELTTSYLGKSWEDIIMSEVNFIPSQENCLHHLLVQKMIAWGKKNSPKNSTAHFLFCLPLIQSYLKSPCLWEFLSNFPN